MFRIINSSINLPKIDRIEMVVKGDTEVFRKVYVSLSIYYVDGTCKTIHNNPFQFPEYEIISLIELKFDDTAVVLTPYSHPEDVDSLLVAKLGGVETFESSTTVFNEMPDADIDAIIDTFNSIMNLALSDIGSSHNKADRFRDDVFQFHATIRNGKGVID